MYPRSSIRVVCCAAGILLFASARGRATDVLHPSADWINTPGYEDSPFLSPDGNHFYFMYTPWSVWPVLFYHQPPVLLGPERLGHHINPDRNPWEDSDIYVSTRQADGTWSTPENLGFNDQQADCCAMTWDGNLFAYQRTQWANSALTDVYFVSRQVDGTWVRVSAGPGVNTSTSSESNPHLSADGKTLYFTSDRPGGYGDRDLYMSRRRPDGTWGDAQNMGPLFNTAAAEDQIWVSRDGSTIYFNRDPGPQIMETTFAHGHWSTPIPVTFGGQRLQAAEVSVTDDGSTIAFAQLRLDLEDIVFVTAHRRADGSWGPVAPIDGP